MSFAESRLIRHPSQRFSGRFSGNADRFAIPNGLDGKPETDGGSPVTTRLPVIEDGEGWFEAVNWVEAARAARDRYVMITLGHATARRRSARCARSRAEPDALSPGRGGT